MVAHLRSSVRAISLFVGAWLAMPDSCAAAPPAPSAIAAHGNWAVRCGRVGARAGFCEIAQQVESNFKERPVLLLSLSCVAEQRRCAIEAELPPRLRTGQVVLFQEDEEKPLELPMIDCDAARCLAGAVLPFETAATIARARRLKITFDDPKAGRLNIPLTVNGLADAIADMIGRNTVIAAQGVSNSTQTRKDTMTPFLAATALASAITPPAATPPKSVATAAPAQSTAAPKSEHYGDWSVLCVDRTDLPPCEAVQGLQPKDAASQPLRFSFAYAGQGDRYGVQFQVPLGILVQVQPLIRLDDKTDLSDFRVTRCEAEGCFIDRVMTKAELEPFFKAAKGLVAVADRAGKPVVLPLSLNGFAQAMQVMTTRNQAWSAKHPAPAATTPPPAKAPITLGKQQ
ncbi:MAG: invasion associated locus B family protein [Sphingomonas phyllosphaerae]